MRLCLKLCFRVNKHEFLEMFLVGLLALTALLATSVWGNIHPLPFHIVANLSFWKPSGLRLCFRIFNFDFFLLFSFCKEQSAIRARNHLHKCSSWGGRKRGTFKSKHNTFCYFTKLFFRGESQTHLHKLQALPFSFAAACSLLLFNLTRK